MQARTSNFAQNPTKLTKGYLHSHIQSLRNWSLSSPVMLAVPYNEVHPDKTPDSAVTLMWNGSTVNIKYISRINNTNEETEGDKITLLTETLGYERKTC